MIDTDRYESMRQLFLDFIDTASDEVDEEAWRNKLTMLDELLAEVKRLREGIKRMAEICEGNSNPWNSNPYLSDALKELIE